MDTNSQKLQVTSRKDEGFMNAESRIPNDLGGMSPEIMGQAEACPSKQPDGGMSFCSSQDNGVNRASAPSESCILYSGFFPKGFSPRPRHRESGIALVIVLSMLMLITVVAVAFTMFSMFESRNSRNFLRATQGDFLVDMALADAMNKIIAGSPQVGSNYYWVSAPGRLWRVGGIDTAGATNHLHPTNEFFALTYTNDYDELALESGFINLYSESTNYYNPASVGFAATNLFVNLNAPQRGYKIAPDENPSGLGGGRIPLTVEWVPVTRDMSRAVSSDNPVVGRYAFWVDAENARVNINDVGIADRTGWRGLSAQEFDPEAVGLTTAELDSYRAPLPVDVGSPNLPLATFTNQAYFRRTEDLRLAGVDADTIKENAFYLTTVGRDLEVDNGGRIPIELDAYNGSTDATLASHVGGGAIDRNHPMAVWGSGNEPLLASKFWNVGSSGGGGPTTNWVNDGPGATNITISTFADVQLWKARYDQDPGGGADNPFLANLGITTYTDIRSDVGDIDFSDINSWGDMDGDGYFTQDDWDYYMGGDGAVFLSIDYTENSELEEITPPGGAEQDVPDIGPNLYVFSDSVIPASSTYAANGAVNSPDWLMPRLMGTRLGTSWDRDKPFSTGFEIRRTTDRSWDRARDYDVVAMQRLTQTKGHTNEPNWFVKLTATNNVQAPASNAVLGNTNQAAANWSGNGKYTWNEFSQFTANMNTWRQSNLPMSAKGEVAFTEDPPYPWDGIGGYWHTGEKKWPSRNTVINPITPSGGLIQANITNIVRGLATRQPVVLNQNLGNRPLPYINEVGISVNMGASRIRQIVAHLEMWNPAYVYNTNGPAYDLGILILTPEAIYDVDSVWGGTSAMTLPDIGYFTNAVLSGVNSMMSGPNTNPERYRTLTYREMSGDPGSLPTPPPNVGYGGGMPPAWAGSPAAMRGSIWRAPGSINTAQFIVRGAAGNFDSQFDFGATPPEIVRTNLLGGGLLTLHNEPRAYAHKTRYLGRWHAPITGEDPGRFVVLKNAHLVDWRVPQRIDVSLMPYGGMIGNYAITPGGMSDAGWGFRATTAGYATTTDHDGYIEIGLDTGEDGRAFNTALAIGVMQMPSDLNNTNYLSITENMPSLAAGFRQITNSTAPKLAPFYQIIPQPRINPGDEEDMPVGGDEGMPQTKWLPFLNIHVQNNGTTTVSREVDDPRVNSRAAQIDFRRTSANETNNLVNTYDANDWGMMTFTYNPLLSAVPNSMGTISSLPRDNYRSGVGTSWGAAAGNGEVAAGALLTGVTPLATASTGANWPGQVGAINQALTQVNSANGWSTTGTNWTAMSGAKPRFSGWGDGDGDLTSQVYKMNDFEHPAELGYVHSGRPWRTMRFGRSYHGLLPDYNIKQVTVAGVGILSITNTIDTTNSVPDWYLFDQFLGLAVTPDNVPQLHNALINTNGFAGSSLGAVSNPRRGTMALNPTIFTKEYPNGVPANQARLKPLYSMLSGVASGATLTNLVQAVYNPRNAISGAYEAYSPGATADRYGIPGVIDSPGELSEVFGRMTSGTINASAPYTDMVTALWQGNSPTFPSHTGDTSGADTVWDAGWAGAGFAGGAVTLDATTSAFPKELLRAIGAQMSPRTRFFRVYICAQSLSGSWTDGQPNANTKVSGEFWKEVLVERYNNYNESGLNSSRPEYRVIWEKSI